MFDSEKFKNMVDEKLNEIPESLLHIDKSLQAKELRDRILDLNSYHSRYNELHDKAKLACNLQDNKINMIKSVAMKLISEDSNYSKLTAPAKLLCLETYSVNIGNEMTTLNQEKEKLEWYQYRVNRFKSRFEDIKMSIMSCVNALSYDKQEMESMS